MKIRQAKKILNMMERGTDTRYFDSKYTFKKESRFIPRLKNLYQKATIRWNKVNMPSANVSLFRSILRTSKECSRCKHYKGNEFIGRCTKLHNNVESSDCVVVCFSLKNNYGNRIIPTQLSQPSGDFFVKDN